MASKRSHVFRVTGLSRKLLDEELKTELHDALNDNFADDERSHIKAEITIVPSCYESDTERAALVQFRGGVPQFLRELRVDPLGDWQVEMGDDDINFDCHFFGFTQLYASVDKEPVVADIIAIAGLDGHAYGSWQGRGNLGRMWLRDFLSKDLPQCRTMIYGYNSKLSSHGVDTILDYGRELMEEIKKIRNTKELQQRPLIFIAHSFGGIIMAHCLVKAIQTMEEDHPAITSLHRATYGMILFAIPHKGLVMDDIQQMLAGDQSHPREQLLKQISSKSDLLMHQLADFKNLIRDRKVVSFYETEQTRQLVLDSESGRWTRTGDFMTTVGADSALLQLPDHTEDKVPLHADHSMVVKFDTRNAAGYRTALDKLRQFSKDAQAVVAARFTQMHQKPQPCSTVPFKKDPMFVGREVVISAIREKHGAIGERHDRVALVGLAGVGKTQTAIEYTYRVRESTPDTWVFWIHASSAARLEQGYQQIAVVAEIPERDDPKINILQLVYQWLCDARNGRWLMVLDNADDDGIFFSGNKSNERGPLVSFLPQATHGSILITSRNGLAARNLVGSDSYVIIVQPMDEDESLTLLRARIPTPQSGESGEDEKALVKALEYIPLAITQAGSYIANRSPRVTVSWYHRLFRESESNQTHLLQHEDAKDLRRDPSIRHAVITTWQISFEQIRHDRPAATNLLALMSMFDRQGIPEGLVRADNDELQFEDAVAPLISYSLIQVEIQTGSFDMHRLVQLSVRVWLEIHLELGKWQEKSRAIMAEMFPNGEYENWRECQRLLPHAKEVVKSISAQHEDRLHVATIYFNCGRYLLHRGTYEEAEVMQRWGLDEREKVLGSEHYDTLGSMADLASTYRKQGRLEEAEQLEVRVLKTLKTKLGENHRDTLVIKDNLAMTYRKQGRWQEAEQVGVQVMETCKTNLGEKHPDTLISMANLALTYNEQGRWKEAEQLSMQVMGMSKSKLGEDHPDTLAVMANLASTNREQGRWEEAEQLSMQAMEMSKSKLGEDHPDTLISMANLALTYSKQGRWKEAEQLNMQVMETRKTKLGQDHPDTLSSMANLAATFWNQDQWEEAEQLGVQVMEARKAKLGSDHPDTLTVMANLASTYSEQGRWEEAEQLGLQVMETCKRKLGEDHPHMLKSMANLVSTYNKQGRWEEAEQLGVQVMEARKTKLGDDHPDTLSSMANLSLTYSKQGRWKEAEQLDVQVMDTRKTKLGKDHPNTLTSLGNLAWTYRNQGRWEEVEQLEVQMMEMSKSKLGEDHPDTLAVMANLASTYSEQGRWKEAEQLDLQVMDTRKTKLGKDHPDTLTSMVNLASTYRNQGRWKDAEQLNVQMMEIRKTKLGEDHPETLADMANLASSYRNQHRWEEAEKLELQVMETCKRNGGEEHLSTLKSMANLALTWKSLAHDAKAINLLRDCLIKQKRILGLDHPITSANSITLLAWETDGLDANAEIS